MEQNELDKLFRHALYNREELPNEDVWEKLAQRLDTKNEEKIILPTKFTTKWRIYGAAASILLLIGTSYWYVGKLRPNTSLTKTTDTTQNLAIIEHKQPKEKYQTNTQDTQPNPDPKPKPKKQLTPAPQKTPPTSNPKEGGKPKPNPTKPKILRPIPTRTELVAMDIKPRQPKKIRIIPTNHTNQPTEAIVTVILQPQHTQQPDKRKNNLLQNLFAGKYKKNKRQLKMLKEQTDKILAFVKD